MGEDFLIIEKFFLFMQSPRDSGSNSEWKNKFSELDEIGVIKYHKQDYNP